MANTKISQMVAADALSGSEMIPLVQAGVNKRTTPAAIRTGLALADASYATINDETGALPNSRRLVQGANITLDTTTPGQMIINAAGGGVGAGNSLIGSSTFSDLFLDSGVYQTAISALIPADSIQDGWGYQFDFGFHITNFAGAPRYLYIRLADAMSGQAPIDFAITTLPADIFIVVGSFTAMYDGSNYRNRSLIHVVPQERGVNFGGMAWIPSSTDDTPMYAAGASVLLIPPPDFATDAELNLQFRLNASDSVQITPSFASLVRLRTA